MQGNVINAIFDISHNKITDISGILGCHNLVSLDLSVNKLKELSPKIGSLGRILMKIKLLMISWIKMSTFV